MSAAMKASLALVVYPEDAEHPTQWSPEVSRDAAVLLLDSAIERAEGHVRHLRSMRDLVAATTSPGPNTEGKVER